MKSPELKKNPTPSPLKLQACRNILFFSEAATDKQMEDLSHNMMRLLSRFFRLRTEKNMRQKKRKSDALSNPPVRKSEKPGGKMMAKFGNFLISCNP